MYCNHFGRRRRDFRL